MATHPQLGTYQLAVEHGAFGSEGRTSAGAALLHLGKAAGTTGTPALQQQPPLDTARTTPSGRPAGGRDGRRYGRWRVRGDARFVVHLLPGEDVVPGHAGGEHAAMTTHSAVGLAAVARTATADRRAACRHRGGSAAAGPRRGRRRAPGRPRRWPRASSGWSPTATSSPTRCSASPSPARPRPSSPSASAAGCAASPTPGSGRPSPWTRTVPSRSAASPSCRPTTRMRVGWSASTLCGWGTSRSRGCCPRRPRGSTPTRWSSRYDGDVEELTSAESTVTEAVVSLAGEMAEHLLDPEDVSRYIDEFEVAMLAVPKGVTKKRLHPMETETGPAGAAQPAGDPADGARLPRPQTPARRDGLRRPDGTGGAARTLGSGHRGDGADPVPGGAARRVPGHLGGAAGDAAVPVRGGRRLVAATSA